MNESCDDGGTASLDGCSSLCAAEAGWTLDNTGGTTVSAVPIHGDGLVVDGEFCDDGNTNDGLG